MFMGVRDKEMWCGLWLKPHLHLVQAGATEAAKDVTYQKDDFFDNLSCEALERGNDRCVDLGSSLRSQI